MDVALDWLMVHVEWKDLPKCFTNVNAIFSTKTIIEVVKAPTFKGDVWTTLASRSADTAIHKNLKTQPLTKAGDPSEKRDLVPSQKDWVLERFGSILTDESSDPEVLKLSSEELNSQSI